MPIWYCTHGGCGMHGKAIDLDARPGKDKKPKCWTCNRKLTFISDLNSDDGPQLLLSEGQPSKVDVQLEQGEEALEFKSNCDLEGCPIAPKCTIAIPLALYQQWVFLCKKLPVEWLAYLMGEVSKDGNRITLAADGMYFPKQLCEGAHVEACEGEEFKAGTIASVHSHVRMNAFFSNEDKAHFNHPADLVVNAFGEASGVMRRKLECGRHQRVEAALLFTECAAELELLNQLKGVMTVQKTQTVVAGDDWYKRRYSQRSGDYQTKGQHGIRIYSADDMKAHLRNIEKEDDERYSEWQDRFSGPERTFRRTDGGRWEDLRDR